MANTQIKAKIRTHNPSDDTKYDSWDNSRTLDNILNESNLAYNIGLLAKRQKSNAFNKMLSAHSTRDESDAATIDNSLYRAIYDNRQLIAKQMVAMLRHHLGDKLDNIKEGDKLEAQAIDLAAISKDKHTLIHNILADYQFYHTVFGASALTLAVALATAATILLLLQASVIATPAIATTMLSSNIFNIACITTGFTAASISGFFGVNSCVYAHHISKGLDKAELNFELDLEGPGHF